MVPVKTPDALGVKDPEIVAAVVLMRVVACPISVFENPPGLYWRIRRPRSVDPCIPVKVKW